MTNTTGESALAAPLAAMRGRLSAVPRPPRVVLPQPVPGDLDGTTASGSQTIETDGDRLGHDDSSEERSPLTGDHPLKVASPVVLPIPSAQQEGPAVGFRDDEGLRYVTELLAAAQEKGFRRIVRDLYDDEGWEDGVNMTWALPRAIRDTVARFGAGADLANKRAAATVLYLGLLQLGLNVRVNTPDEDRSVRRRT